MTIGCTSTRSTRAPGCALGDVGARSVRIAASSAVAILHAEHDAADVGLVRDLGGQHLDGDRIGEGQGGRAALMPTSSATAGARAMPRRSSSAPASSSSSRRAVACRRGERTSPAIGRGARRAQRRRDGVGAGLGRAEARHAGRGEQRQRLRRVGHQEGGERLAGARAVDDRPHRQFRMRRAPRSRRPRARDRTPARSAGCRAWPSSRRSACRRA